MVRKLNKISTFWILVLGAAMVLCFLLGSGVMAEETNQEEDQVDEEKVEETEEGIEKYEKKLKKETQEKAALDQSLNQIQYSIYGTQKEINTTEEKIEETEETISRKESEMSQLNNKIDFQKEILKVLFRERFYEKKKPGSSLVLGNRDFSKIIANVDYLYQIEEKINSVIEDIKDTRVKIEGDKEQLEESKKDHESLLALKEGQQQTLVVDKIQVQAKVNEKEATISQLNSKLSKLRGELSKLLGKSYDFSDIKDAAKFASKATGVRKDFIMGMLVVESDLGRFTGGCDYKESRMSSYRKDVFKKICDELDYNYKKMKVSCPPKSYKGTGGAMGVAQFMSDTWWGYKDRIASATGHNPPDPWNLTDGVTAMAIKLANDGATKKSGECKAAMRYLGGSHQWYCDRVIYWANNYERLLD